MLAAHNTSCRSERREASRFRCLAAMAGIFLLIGLCTRVALFFLFPADFTGSLGNAATALTFGFLNDFASLVFVLTLPVLLLMPPSDRFYERRAGCLYMSGVLFLFTGLLVFTAFAEYFFWDEFHCRFNFIAVDYLIYTTEVIGNIRESYPLVPLFGAIGLLSVGVTTLFWKMLVTQSRSATPTRFVSRLLLIGVHGAAVVLVFLCFSPLNGNTDKNFQESGHNGVYELFSAFRQNSLDYRAFYPQIDKDEAFRIVKTELTEPDADFISSNSLTLNLFFRFPPVISLISLSILFNGPAILFDV